MSRSPDDKQHCAHHFYSLYRIAQTKKISVIFAVVYIYIYICVCVCVCECVCVFKTKSSIVMYPSCFFFKHFQVVQPYNSTDLVTVPHPPYSPDLAPCDFWLFPNFTDCRYETIEEMKGAVTKVIDTLTQENFHEVYQKLLER